jgi:hypothetical protein
MLEQLMDLVRQNAGDAVINNPAVPNEHNDAVVAEAGHSIMGGLKDMIAQGNIQDVANLFQHNGGDITATPAAQQLQGGFIQNLVNKFGLDRGTAGGVAGSLLPSVLRQLVHKTNDPNDNSFTIQNIVQQLGGAGVGNGVDMQGLIGRFTGAGSGGGVLDSIKGVFSR